MTTTGSERTDAATYAADTRRFAPRGGPGVRPYRIICQMILYDDARAVFASSRS
jgi:hypothetical protein